METRKLNESSYVFSVAYSRRGPLHHNIVIPVIHPQSPFSGSESAYHRLITLHTLFINTVYIATYTCFGGSLLVSGRLSDAITQHQIVIHHNMSSESEFEAIISVAVLTFMAVVRRLFCSVCTKNAQAVQTIRQSHTIALPYTDL